MKRKMVKRIKKVIATYGDPDFNYDVPVEWQITTDIGNRQENSLKSFEEIHEFEVKFNGAGWVWNVFRKDGHGFGTPENNPHRTEEEAWKALAGMFQMMKQGEKSGWNTTPYEGADRTFKWFGENFNFPAEVFAEARDPDDDTKELLRQTALMALCAAYYNGASTEDFANPEWTVRFKMPQGEEVEFDGPTLWNFMVFLIHIGEPILDVYHAAYKEYERTHSWRDAIRGMSPN